MDGFFRRFRISGLDGVKKVVCDKRHGMLEAVEELFP